VKKSFWEEYLGLLALLRSCLSLGTLENKKDKGSKKEKRDNLNTQNQNIQNNQNHQDNQELLSAALEPLLMPQLKDWIQAVDALRRYISKKHLEIDLLEVNEFSFMVMQLVHILMRMDLQLSKIKSYYQNYTVCAKEFNEIEKESYLEFITATNVCQDMHQIILDSVKTLEALESLNGLSHKKVSKVFARAHSRIKEKITHLKQSIDLLNDVVLKKRPLYKLIDNEWLLSLYQLENIEVMRKIEAQGQETGIYCAYFYPAALYPSIDAHAGVSEKVSEKNLFFKDNHRKIIAQLKHKAQKIYDVDLRIIAFDLINQYEFLSKYMIFSVSKSLSIGYKVLYDYITQFISYIIQKEALSDYISDTDTNTNTENINTETVALHEILNAIFRAIESLRFIANTNNSFTRSLQDAAKLSKKQLCKDLEKTPKGQLFLNLHQRMSLQTKLDMKSRFRKN